MSHVVPHLTTDFQHTIQPQCINTYIHICLNTLMRHIKEWLAYSCQAFSISSVYL